MFLTIIGIPVGFQLFKIASFVLWPFGKHVVDVNVNGFKMVLNIIWAIFFGWEFLVGYVLLGLLFCLTFIGIPFGLQLFKLGSFLILPLGRDFVVD